MLRRQVLFMCQKIDRLFFRNLVKSQFCRKMERKDKDSDDYDHFEIQVILNC